MSKLSANLKRLRGNHSQTEFSKVLGISQARYANYELGNREPDLDTLVRIARVCGKTTDQLLGVSDLGPPDRAVNKVADLKRAILTILKEY